MAGWARRYQAALCRHMARRRAGMKLPSALRLGRQAVALGMETLDMVRVHEQAWVKLMEPGGSCRTRPGMLVRARRFFAEAVVPIERTHRAAQEAQAHVRKLTDALSRRDEESSASTRDLKQGIARRQAAEVALRKSREHRVGQMRELRQLQQRLREQTRALLATQEDERKADSRRLHDEIAQTLLAIQLRLLSLKSSARSHKESLQKEIALTQRLVRKSVHMINRSAHEVGVHHET